MEPKGRYERARQYLETHQDVMAKAQGKISNDPVLTVSRETGAGASVVCEKIINILKDEGVNLTLFDKKLIQKVIEDEDLPQNLRGYLTDEKAPGISATLNELFGLHPPTSSLIKYTTKIILQIAHAGNVIIVGRGGNIITSNLNNAFHVRLTAPFDVRLRYIQEYYKLDKRKATEHILEEEKSRRNYINTLFQRKNDDPLLYHLIINTHLLGYEGTANLIASKLLDMKKMMSAKVG